MKTIFLSVFIVAFIVAGAGCGSVSNRLSTFVYLDSVLIAEAKAGRRDALIGLVGHIVGLLSFFIWLYLALSN